jgi:hypothetical protein
MLAWWSDSGRRAGRGAKGRFHVRVVLRCPGSRPRQWDEQAALERVKEAITSSQSTILVACLEEEMIAFCTIYFEFTSVRFGRRCWLEDFAVDSGRRSLGVGQRYLTPPKHGLAGPARHTWCFIRARPCRCSSLLGA